MQQFYSNKWNPQYFTQFNDLRYHFRSKNILLPIKILKVAQIMRFSWKKCSNHSNVFIMFKKLRISIPIFQFSTFKKSTRSLYKHFERQKQAQTSNNALTSINFDNRSFYEFLQNKQENITYIRTSSIPTSIELNSKLHFSKKKTTPIRESPFYSPTANPKKYRIDSYGTGKHPNKNH